MPDQLSKPYCKSVLRVAVPLVVTLARKSMPVEQVLQLVPGMMIQFDKHCDTPMTVEVADQPIATGDIVKTGDMFGIRINDILKPSERFLEALRRPRISAKIRAERPSTVPPERNPLPSETLAFDYALADALVN